MKFSVTILSLLFASSVQGSMLRANKQAASKNNVKSILDAEVILKGTEGKPSSEDMDFIGKALVTSYNNIHWEAGHFLTGEHVVDFKGPDNIMCKFCPDDDSMGDATMNIFSVKAPVGIMCKFCPDDDAMGGFESILTTAVTNDCAGLCEKDATEDLEANFCDKIKSFKGSKYLNSAKSCSIKFDTDADKNEVAHSGSSPTNKRTMDSTIILKGPNGDATSKDELAIIAKAFISAYNDVHWDTKHYLADAEIPFSAGTPDPDNIMCKFCPDDDSMGGVSSTNTLVFNVVTPIVDIMCKFCPDDDSIGSSQSFDIESLKTMESNKKAVEDAFCNKIQNSVSDKLSMTTSCFIDYLGGNQDENGCLISAGYFWCESAKECQRPWEKACEDSTEIM